MLKRQSCDTILAIGLALLLTGYIVLLWPGLHGPFLFDDIPNLQNLATYAGQADNLGEYLAVFQGSPGRPIATLSFLINDNAWPSNPFAFKYTNVLLHLLNGVVLFGLMRQLQAAKSSLPQNIFWPLLVMAAWLFHPIQVSTQMLVVQRMTLLSAFFTLAGLWAYIAVLRNAKNWLSTLYALIVLGAATILAFLCKENGALTPIYALVLNMTLLSERIQQKSEPSKRLLAAGIYLPSLLVIFSIAYLAIQPHTFLSREFTLYERALSQLHVVYDYLLQIFIPRLSGSGIFFDDYPITREFTSSPFTIALAIGFALLLAFTFAQRKRFPLFAFAVLWYFAGHLMESTILDLELYFEHRNYLPLAGPMAALCASPFLFNRLKSILVALLLAWIAMLALISGLQAQTWGNQKLLANIWAAEHPASLRANQQITSYYFDAGQYQKAFDLQIAAQQAGLPEVDYPLSALLIKCLRPEVASTGNLITAVTNSLPKSPYSNSSMQYIQLLRNEVLSGTCADTLNQSDWLLLTDAFIGNAVLQPLTEPFLRNERASLYAKKLDLNLTMQELQRAYEIAPSIELSQKIAEVLLSAGLVDDAEKWLKAGLELKQPFFDSLMYDPKERSRRLLEIIIETKSNKTKKLMLRNY
jgi:protein O-mannosyl-transferase